MSTGPLLFRNQEGEVQPYLSHLEGITYKSNPMMFFIFLARYKFAARHLKKTDRVLDAGCGPGIGSVMLAQAAGSVVGLDYDPGLVAQCRKQYGDLPSLTFAQADLLAAPYEPNAFDAVVCIDVVEHFAPQDGERFLNHLAASLKDGGLAIIGTPNSVSAPYASKRRKHSHPVEYDPRTFDTFLAREFRRRRHV